MTSQDFTFNTAITGIGGDGELDKPKHKIAIHPLRVQIMQVDGVVSCFIARYGLSIEFIPEIITRAELYERVCAAIDTVISQESDSENDEVVNAEADTVASQENEPENDSDDGEEISQEISLKLFPYRGDKTPTLVEPGWLHAQKQEPEPSHQVKIFVTYSTHVIALPPSPKEAGNYSREEFAIATYELAKALSDIDGVLQQEIGLERAKIVIDTRYGDVQATIDHMRTVLTGAKDTMPGIFPYIDSSEELELTFRTAEV